MMDRVWEVRIVSRSEKFWGENSTYHVRAANVNAAVKKGMKCARDSAFRAPEVVKVVLIADVDA